MIARKNGATYSMGVVLWVFAGLAVAARSLRMACFSTDGHYIGLLLRSRTMRQRRFS